MTWAIVGIGVAAVSLGTTIAGNIKAKKDRKKENERIQSEEFKQAEAFEGQLDLQANLESRNVLSGYNPQGEAQMYANRGANLYYKDNWNKQYSGLGFQTGGKRSNPIYVTQATPGSKYESGDLEGTNKYYKDALTKQWGEGNLQSYVANAAEMTGVDPQEFAAAMIQEGWHPDRFAGKGQFKYNEEGKEMATYTPEEGLSSYYAIGLDTVGEHLKEIGAKTGYKASDYASEVIPMKNEQGQQIKPMHTKDYQKMINTAAALYKYRSEISDNTAKDLGIDLTNEQRQYFNYMAYNTQHNSPYVQGPNNQNQKGNESLEMMMKDFKKKGNFDKSGQDWSKAVQVATGKEREEGILYNPYKKGSGKAHLYKNAGDSYRRIGEIKNAYSEVEEEPVMGPPQQYGGKVGYQAGGANYTNMNLLSARHMRAGITLKKKKNGYYQVGGLSQQQGTIPVASDTTTPSMVAPQNIAPNANAPMSDALSMTLQGEGTVNQYTQGQVAANSLAAQQGMPDVQAGNVEGWAKPGYRGDTAADPNVSNRDYWANTKTDEIYFDESTQLALGALATAPLKAGVSLARKIGSSGHGVSRGTGSVKGAGSHQSIGNTAKEITKVGRKKSIYESPREGLTRYAAGGLKPYPYQDQPRTMINPTTTYYHGGMNDQMGMQVAHPFGPTGVPGYRGGGDIGYQGGGFSTGMGLNVPANMNLRADSASYSGPGSEFRNQFNPGQAQNPNQLPNEGNMYDQLQTTNMQEYQSYQRGGAQRVEGGELEQLNSGAQKVIGDNPNAVDGVNIDGNSNQPDISLDDQEVVVEAEDENGRHKQIFSHSIMVPGENKTFAKKAEGYQRQIAKAEKSYEINKDDKLLAEIDRIREKNDQLFEMQQMINGDSEGENAEEAIAGGMDPNAAMGMEGQAYQKGGTAPATTSNAARIASTSLSAINAGIQGYSSGYAMGYGFTPDAQGNRNMAMGLAGASSAASGLATSAGQVEEAIQASKQAAEQERIDIKRSEVTTKEAIKKSSEATMVLSQTAEESDVNDEAIANALDQSFARLTKSSKAASGYQSSGGADFNYGGVYYNEGGMGYNNGGMAIMIVPMYTPETSLSDLQLYSKSENWGHFDEEDTLRRTSIGMGRLHRRFSLDASPVISESERNGPTPSLQAMRKARSARLGARIGYGSPLNLVSLTLAIL